MGIGKIRIFLIELPIELPIGLPIGPIAPYWYRLVLPDHALADEPIFSELGARRLEDGKHNVETLDVRSQDSDEAENTAIQ